MDDTMTPRQRVLAALRGEKLSSTPGIPAYLSLFLADFERAAYIDQYRHRLRGCARISIDHAEDTRFRAQALYQAYGIFKQRPDWIEVHQGASREWAMRTDIVLDGLLYYEDRLTGQRWAMHEAPLPYGGVHVPGSVSSTTDLWDVSAQYREPADVDASLPLRAVDQIIADGSFELPRQIIAEHGDRYFISTILDTPFSDAYDLLGFQGLMVIQHDRPDLLHYMLQRRLAQSLDVMAAWATIGVDGVYVQEVFTGADVLSPRSYDEFVYEYNRPYFHHMWGLGLLPIHYVCGDVIPRLDRILSLDLAAIGVEESKKNFRIEIDDVVDRVGDRAAVFGNIDAVRFGLDASLEDMAAEVKRQVRIGSRAKGFVVSTGSPFPLDTNPRLIDTLVATAHSLPGLRGALGRA